MEPDLRDLQAQAMRFADDPALVQVTAEVAANSALWEEANRDPDAFLRERVIDLPPGLSMRPIPMPGFGMPSPDWLPFTITLTHCRTMVVRDEHGKIYTEEVCFGWEVVPTSPPGPIG
jgi:hypothetical protein